MHNSESLQENFKIFFPNRDQLILQIYLCLQVNLSSDIRLEKQTNFNDIALKSTRTGNSKRLEVIFRVEIRVRLPQKVLRSHNILGYQVRSVIRV